MAGCSALSSEPRILDLTLFNHVESPFTVELSMFRTDGDLSRSDARVFEESIDVDPEGEARRTNVAELQRYLVKYDVYEENSRRTDQDHVHYYPYDGGEDDTKTFDIRQPGVMTRRQ